MPETDEIVQMSEFEKSAFTIDIPITISDLEKLIIHHVDKRIAEIKVEEANEYVRQLEERHRNGDAEREFLLQKFLLRKILCMPN